MHLTQHQAARFFELYYSLLSFANCRFSVLEQPYQPYSMDLGAEQTMALSDYVFNQNGSVIDCYLSENPRGLGEGDLAQVSNWKVALFGMFAVVEHRAEHSVFMMGEHLFNVIGSSASVSDLVGYTPALVQTVLLPFEGSIVCGLALTEFPIAMGDETFRALAGSHELLLERGAVVASAEDFLREAPQLRDRAEQA